MLNVGTGITLVLALGSIQSAHADAYRKITLSPQNVYTSFTGNAEGAGYEVIVRLTNISSQVQTGRVRLYGERLKVYLEKRGNGSLDSLVGSSTQYNRSTSGVNAQAECKPTLSGPPSFCDQPSTAERATQAGEALGYRLEPAGSSGSTATVSFRLYAHVGMGGINTRWSHTGRALVGTVPGNPVDVDQSEVGITGNRTHEQAMGNPKKMFCRNNVAPAPSQIYASTALDCHPDVSGLMQIGYEFGVSVDVNEVRGAVVASVMYRDFELGPLSIEAFKPTSVSIPLAGGKAF